MQRIRLDVLALDGTREILVFERDVITVGRGRDNAVVLDHDSVSNHHCEIRLDPDRGLTVEDRGSTNGTWIGDHRVTGIEPLERHSELTVGNVVIIVFLDLWAEVSPGLPNEGRFILHDKPRPVGLDSRPPRSFGRDLRDSLVGQVALMLLFGTVVGFLALFTDIFRTSPAADADSDADLEQGENDPPPQRLHEPSDDPRVDKQTFEHTVIPAETLEQIALRYDVSIPALMRWNGIDEQTPLTPGQTLQVTASKRPLAQQMIVYRTDQDESWTRLAKRFDVPVEKLRAYNPTIEAEPRAGAELTVWIDPKPLVRKTHVQIPEFEVRPDAISVGAPRDGKLINGIQFPAEDQLYKRRKPYIMWCSSHMAKHLREAIAAFRYTYEFEGEIVVADMSQRGGGKFPPHKSHQAGRDVDIWLPTLKGVYQQNHLRRDRMPSQSEADWFALYGFLKALHETGEVQQVYLDYILQDRVYRAAKLMGASEEELDVMIAYPRGAHHHKSLLQHSPGHIHHIHVRFKCGPNDQCAAGVDTDPGD